MAPIEKEEIIAQAEDIFGQYLYAVGSGAGQMWVKRSAVRALREHYLDIIIRAIADPDPKTDWNKNAPHVLSYVRAIGALAADYALAKGLHVIGARDMMLAVQKVEANYNRPRTAEGDVEPLGAWCPPDDGGDR